MFDLPIWAWIVLVVLNVPVFLLAGRWVFGGWDGFKESVRFAIQPDWFSFWRGELVEDWQEGIRMLIFLLVCAAAVLAEAFLLSLAFGGGG